MIRIVIILLLLVSGCTTTPTFSENQQLQCVEESIVIADSCWRKNAHMTFETCLSLAHRATGSCYVVVGYTK